MSRSTNIQMAMSLRFAAAIERADLKTTKRLLSRGADVNTRCPNPRDLQTSWFALLRSVYLGHTHIVQLLLLNGARSDMRLNVDQHIHENGRTKNDASNDNAAVELASATPIYVAAARHYKHGNGLKIIKLLLEHNADPNATNAVCSTPLMAAVEHGGGIVIIPGQHKKSGLRNIDETMDDQNIVTLLLENGADPSRRDRNGWTPLLLGAYLGREDEVRHLLEYTTPNFETIQNGVTNMLSHFRSRPGCSPKRMNVKPREELSQDYAGQFKFGPQRKRKQEQEQEPDGMGNTQPNQDKDKDHSVSLSWKSTIVDDRDENGRTPLMLACQQKKSNVVELLLKHGADVDAFIPRSGWTSVMFCLKSGSVECVKFLLKLNCSIGILSHPTSIQTNPLSSIKSGTSNKWENARTAVKQRTNRRLNNIKTNQSTSNINNNAINGLSDTLLFPRDELTGWTPVMIGCHHCISVQHATVLRLILEKSGPVNPEIFQVDKVAFPNEMKTPYDLAHARGNTAALRLLQEANKRYIQYQELVTGRKPLPTVNQKLQLMLKKDLIEKNSYNLAEKREAERANRNRIRRREERKAKKRDIEEEDQVLSSRKDLKIVQRKIPMPTSPIRLLPIATEDGKDDGVPSVMETEKDKEMQLMEAMNEIKRLNMVLDGVRKEKQHWRDACRRRETELSEQRRSWQIERKELIQGGVSFEM